MLTLRAYIGVITSLRFFKPSLSTSCGEITVDKPRTLAHEESAEMMRRSSIFFIFVSPLVTFMYILNNSIFSHRFLIHLLSALFPQKIVFSYTMTLDSYLNFM